MSRSKLCKISGEVPITRNKTSLIKVSKIDVMASEVLDVYMWLFLDNVNN